MKLRTLLFFAFPILLFSQSASTPSAQKSRQFDFWLGEWDVNLRVKQKDHSWKDMHQSVARIYPVLDSTAVLELWEEQNREKGIIGYSLRYYDPEKDQWMLYLNWPGPNDSGSHFLTGAFRHGRVEFFGEQEHNDSTRTKFRFTFSDITKNSLRWDNAMSKDDGKTWGENWIMEFSRKRNEAPALQLGQKNLTSGNAFRCDLEPFAIVQRIAAFGKLSAENSSKSWYGVLEGCSVMSITHRKGGFQEFSILTYNTDKNAYEELVMDNKTPKAEIFYGQQDKNGSLVLVSETSPEKKRVLKASADAFEITQMEGSKETAMVFKK